MKIVGIIGGLGPGTTARFYESINQGCWQLNKVQRPAMLIWNVPLPYHLERDLLDKNNGQERYLPFLIEAARRLEAAEADFLVMPCNSLHIFIEEIRSSVKIPLLSIVDETVKFLANQKLDRVGLIATRTTLSRNLYAQALNQQGITGLAPTDSQQQRIDSIIQRLVISEPADKDRESLLQIIHQLNHRGAHHIVLACTDLQLLLPSSSRQEIHDSMAILAAATIRELNEENLG